MLVKSGRSYHNEGHIQLIFGPMFSGKTTEMLRRLNRYRLTNRKCVIVKYINDTRFSDDKVSTHDRQMQEAIGAVKLSDVMEQLAEAEVIAIDEGQFFEDIAEYSEALANNGKVVIVSALDGDYNRLRFKNILNVCPFAEDVTKLNAVCTLCGQDASFTKRLTAELDQEVIGGSDVYTALCRYCYLSSIFGTCEINVRNAYRCGRIELIIGPMFSGKTSELVRRRNRHALANRPCIIIQYGKRIQNDENHLTTHDQLILEALKAERLSDIFERLLAYKVIGIDNGQFFPDIVEYSEHLANAGKIVMIAALDGDSNRKEFQNQFLDLLPLAEDITKLHAVCTECKSDASFSKLFKFNFMGTAFSRNAYCATCRTCYFKSVDCTNIVEATDKDTLKPYNSSDRADRPSDKCMVNVSKV